MPKKDKLKLYLVLAISITMVLSIQSNKILADPFFEIKEKLDSISEEQKEILQNLFILTQEIEGIEKEEEQLSKDIEKLNLEIKEIQEVIELEEETYEKNKEGLKQVLKSYQRMGPGSYIEIILDSDNLNMLLRRINTLQDFTSNTGELLNSVEESRDKLLMQKSKLDEKLIIEEEKQKLLKESLVMKMKLKEDKEEFLKSLEGEREYYQEYLTIIQKMWIELKSIFKEAAKEFSRIVKEEDLPEDAIDVSFSLFNIKGTIGEKTFNDIIKEHSQLPNMIFRFTSGIMELELPDNNLILKGKLILSNGNILKFEPEEGSFYGMPLEKWAINEMFSGADLVLNLDPLLGGNTLQSIEIKEKYLELLVIPFWKVN